MDLCPEQQTALQGELDLFVHRHIDPTLSVQIYVNELYKLCMYQSPCQEHVQGLHSRTKLNSLQSAILKYIYISFVSEENDRRYLKKHMQHFFVTGLN